jgi:small subunit ribosomal protein S4
VQHAVDLHVRDGRAGNGTEQDAAQRIAERNSETALEWLEYNDAENSARVVQLPSREQIDTPVDEQLIVEYYSR